MTSISYLNTSVLDAIDPAKFQTRAPFPWTNPQYFIRPACYRELVGNLPDLSRFNAFFGKQRKWGLLGKGNY